MSVLVVAAHPDDEVLGCGGTIARLVNKGNKVHVLLLADGESSRNENENAVSQQTLEARNSAAEEACKILGCSTLDSFALPDNRMDSVELLDVVKIIESAIDRYKPETVITHHVGDVNIDHRIAHDAVLAACRPQADCSVKELWFYEVPSSTEWNPPGSNTYFQPNLFVDITDTLSKKLEAMQAYKSELREFPHPRSLKGIGSLANWRGATVGVIAAEAFILGRKQI